MQPRRRMLALVKLPICLVLIVVPLLLDYSVPDVFAASFKFTNDAGQIVGSFTDTQSVVHGFLASIADVDGDSGGAGGSADTTPPAVSMTAPAPGTTISSGHHRVGYGVG